MGRMKKLSDDERRDARRALFEAAGKGELAVGDAVRRMRLITGLTQADFARRIAGISPGALAQIESGRGNPTIETLDKIGAAFGLEVGFVRKRDHSR